MRVRVYVCMCVCMCVCVRVYLSRAEVEPRVEFVDDVAVSGDGKEAKSDGEVEDSTQRTQPHTHPHPQWSQVPGHGFRRRGGVLKRSFWLDLMEFLFVLLYKMFLSWTFGDIFLQIFLKFSHFIPAPQSTRHFLHMRPLNFPRNLAHTHTGKHKYTHLQEDPSSPPSPSSTEEEEEIIFDSETFSHYPFSVPSLSHSEDCSHGLTGKSAIFANGSFTWRDIYGSPVPPIKVLKDQGLSKKEISHFVSHKYASLFDDVISDDFGIPHQTIRRIFKMYTRVDFHLYARIVRRTVFLSSGDCRHVNVFLVRTFNSMVCEDEVSVGSLTNRMLILFNEAKVISIRRLDLICIARLRSEYGNLTGKQDEHPQSASRYPAQRMRAFEFVNLLIRCALQTYEKPFLFHLRSLDLDFGRVTTAHKRESEMLIRRVTHIKRRCDVLHRIILVHQKVIETYLSFSGQSSGSSEDLMDSLCVLLELGDDNKTEAESLIRLHVTIRRHNSKEILRVLSLISAVLLPASFVCGVYRMDFVHIPELRWTMGYAYVWAVILCVTIVTLKIFHWKGWLY